MKRKVDPLLKVRYATGLGDVITCLLHSRYIGKIVHLLTKKDKPCSSCSNRAYALNILFPIKIWKYFFKNGEEREAILRKDMIDFGYIFHTPKPDKKCECNGGCNEETPKQSDVLNGVKIDYVEYSDYSFVSKEEIEEGDKKTVVLNYKKKY